MTDFRERHRYRPWNERDRRRRFRPLVRPLARVPAFVFEVLAQGGLEFLDDELKPLELRTKEARALLVLAHIGPLSQSALGDRIHLDRTSTSQLLEDLEELGLVNRRPALTDGRAKSAVLTKVGFSFAEQAAQAAETAGRRFLSPLGGAERKRLASLLEVLMPEEVPWWALD
jgi:DNA-binding MarR family transcriptional regulator